MAEDVAYPAAWVPVSLVPQPDGSTLPFPHFYERGKPGYIAVDPTGRRFSNESASYHDFVPAMVEACRFDPWIAYGKGRLYTFSTETFIATP